MRAMQEWSTNVGASRCDTFFFFIMLNYFFGGSMYVSAMDLKHFKNVHTEATVMFSVHTMYCNE